MNEPLKKQDILLEPLFAGEETADASTHWLTTDRKRNQRFKSDQAQRLQYLGFYSIKISNVF